MLLAYVWLIQELLEAKQFHEYSNFLRADLTEQIIGN